MTFSGVILINSVTNYYRRDFYSGLDSVLKTNDRLESELEKALVTDPTGGSLKPILESYYGKLGIDDYRNCYLLDKFGNYIDGTDDELGNKLPKTENLIAALNGSDGTLLPGSSEYCDYAVNLSGEAVLYIKDSMDEMKSFISILLNIVLQSMLVSLLFAVVLSFFLSRTITLPISKLTESAKHLREGDFDHDIEVLSEDEIGMLSATFNEMKTALKNTLDAASNERSKLETVFTYLRDGVIAFTEDGRVLHVNRAAVDLFGKAYDKKFNLTSFMRLLKLDGSSKDKSKSPVPHFSESLVESDIMYEGKVLDINFGNITYSENNTNHEGIITVIHDITGRYELEKARREFVANVSHEMRTPLTSIRGAAESILENRDMHEDIRKMFLDMILTESDRMTHIVSDLLTLSRLDNKKTRWKITRYDLAESIKHVTDVIGVEARAHRHILELETDKSLPEISADRERIEQVLINILSNAVKYTPDGGHIKVSAHAESDSNVVISVSDNGIGIPPDDLDHIFERFYRVEKSRTSETGGTGLGLAIAKEIVSAHGGEISIDSTLGKGSTVTIKLPLVAWLSDSADNA